MSIITIVGFEIPNRNRGAGMRTKDQGTLDKILKFVNKYYQENRVAPTISEVAAGVGVARSTTHRYIQELSDRDFLLDYGRGILSAPESAKMKTAYIDPVSWLDLLRLSGRGRGKTSRNMSAFLFLYLTKETLYSPGQRRFDGRCRYRRR